MATTESPSLTAAPCPSEIVSAEEVTGGLPEGKVTCGFWPKDPATFTPEAVAPAGLAALSPPPPPPQAAAKSNGTATRTANRRMGIPRKDVRLAPHYPTCGAGRSGWHDLDRPRPRP
ncbi:hypothetical protein Sru01_31240 [Sphaerisporangium rufum]|uniref:Uncharacterized protein n=1 Tax=Sphaerisporangium rufum TaxID=1381558 RepID=A0A919R6P1_9ACTN|nr:hypothetical protein Sru01_31240 [Sphaerisporangium rufum]